MNESPEEMRAALARVTRSQLFSTTDRLAEFLEYVVEEAIKGNEAGLKETSIGVGLFGREPGYDPKLDSLVRTQARRVRDRLERYYREEGAADSILIEIPKGSYVPGFRRREEGKLPDASVSDERVQAELPKRRLKLRWVFAVVIGIAVTAVGLVTFMPRRGEGGAGGAPKPRVMVFPFQGNDASSENHLYGHAIADSVVAAIAGIDQLTVLTPREPQEPDPPSAEYEVSQAARASADYVVTGTFDRTKSPAIATVRLTQVSSGEVVWGRQYAFPWSKLVNTEQEMSAALVAKLSARLGEKHGNLVGTVHPASAAAHREFLSGYYAALSARKDANLESYSTALVHLKKALELEPGYPEAHATLAGLYTFRLLPWTVEGPTFLADAEKHARAALERAPNNSDAFAALARCSVQRGDLHAALNLAGQAVQAEPGNADAFTSLADVYTAMGFHEAALEAYLRASRNTFVAMEPFVIGAVTAAGLGRLAVAEELIRNHSAVDPESVMLAAIQGVMRGWKGDYAGAEAIHRRVRATVMARNSPEGMKRVNYSFSDVNLALALTKQNKLDEARAVVSRMPPPMPRRTPFEIYVLAAIGMPDKSIRLIESSPHFRSYRFLVTDPELKPLYSSVQFQDLLDKTYPQWLEFTSAYASSALAKPPVLPTPADFRRANRLGSR